MKLTIEVFEKCKMIKNIKIIIYLKLIIRKLNKFIQDKSKKIYKKLEVNVLKNSNSSSISKKRWKLLKSYKKKTYLPNN